MRATRSCRSTVFRRWRPDKAPEDCRYDQLEVTTPYELARVFEATRSQASRAGIPRARLVMAASVAIALIGGSVLLRSKDQTVVPAPRAFGFVSVEAAMLSGKASLSDWSEEELEMLLKEMES